ncbi:MAG: hypothetical protein ABIE75_02955 [Candidatus Omnitrophota bacterium]
MPIPPLRQIVCGFINTSIASQASLSSLPAIVGTTKAIKNQLSCFARVVTTTPANLIKS